jgi:enoyl-CoA hydratase/carnithine racemase
MTGEAFSADEALEMGMIAGIASDPESEINVYRRENRCTTA